MTITTETGDTLSIHDITDRQEAYKRSLRKAVAATDRKAQKAWIRKGAPLVISEDEIAARVNNGAYNYTRKRHNEAMRHLPVSMRHFTDHQIDKTIEVNALNYVDNMVMPYADADVQAVMDENELTLEQAGREMPLSWCHAEELNGGRIFKAREMQRRRYEWHDELKRSFKKAPPEFYVIIKSDLVSFDTRTRMYVYDKKLKRPVYTPDRAIWDDYAGSIVSIVNKILKAHYGHLPYMQGTEHEFSHLNSETQMRNAWLKKALKEMDMEFTNTFCEVKCVHSKDAEEFPALIFSLTPRKETATRYAYDPEKGINERADEHVVMNEIPTKTDIPWEEGDDEEDKAAKHMFAEEARLTFFQLETAIETGQLDEEPALKVLPIEDAFKSQQAGVSMPIETPDLDVGVGAYINLCLGMDRHDLAEMASDPEGYTTEMTPDIAACVWAGEMLPQDAGALWGDVYEDPEDIMLWDAVGRMADTEGVASREIEEAYKLTDIDIDCWANDGYNWEIQGQRLIENSKKKGTPVGIHKRKKAQWLRAALDILINDGELEIHPLLDQVKAKEEMFQDQVKELIQVYGRDALSALVPPHFRGERSIWIGFEEHTINVYNKTVDGKEVRVVKGDTQLFIDTLGIRAFRTE